MGACGFLTFNSSLTVFLWHLHICCLACFFTKKFFFHFLQKFFYKNSCKVENSEVLLWALCAGHLSVLSGISVWNKEASLNVSKASDTVEIEWWASGSKSSEKTQGKCSGRLFMTRFSTVPDTQESLGRSIHYTVNKVTRMGTDFLYSLNTCNIRGIPQIRRGNLNDGPRASSGLETGWDNAVSLAEGAGAMQTSTGQVPPATQAGGWFRAIHDPAQWLKEICQGKGLPSRS